MPREYQHDDKVNELNAAKAHYSMKWMYRAHNVVLLALSAAFILAPKKDRTDRVLVAAAVTGASLGLWINSEAAQWHQRAAEEHTRRAFV
jgi:hypothetical protein